MGDRRVLWKATGKFAAKGNRKPQAFDELLRYNICESVFINLLRNHQLLSCEHTPLIVLIWTTVFYRSIALFSCVVSSFFGCCYLNAVVLTAHWVVSLFQAVVIWKQCLGLFQSWVVSLLRTFVIWKQFFFCRYWNIAVTSGCCVWRHFAGLGSSPQPVQGANKNFNYSVDPVANFLFLRGTQILKG